MRCCHLKNRTPVVLSDASCTPWTSFNSVEIIFKLHIHLWIVSRLPVCHARSARVLLELLHRDSTTRTVHIAEAVADYPSRAIAGAFDYTVSRDWLDCTRTAFSNDLVLLNAILDQLRGSAEDGNSRVQPVVPQTFPERLLRAYWRWISQDPTLSSVACSVPGEANPMTVAELVLNVASCVS